MEKLSNNDIMPNFKQLKSEYIFKRLRSSIPHISSVSWSSIITGKNPGEHGIFGFTDIINNTYSLSFPNFNALKSKPFWHQKPEKKHIIINVPSTYPAKKLNGIHIAGFVALDLQKAVYPDKYFQKLQGIGYEIDVDSKIAHQQSNDIFFDELFRVLYIRKKTFDLLWKELKWDNFMPVITGSDRIGHFFWHVYEDYKNPLYHRFLEYFQEIDNIIGEIYNKLNEDDTFIILSDHGMERNKYNINLNTYLEDQGFLILAENLKKYNRISKGSKAFVLDPGRIYINKKGSYPNGTVKKEDEKIILDELESLFYNLKYEKQRVIKKVYKRDDIYSGKERNRAPDMVLVEKKGFNLKSGIGKEKIFEEENTLSGKHNENSFILINKEINVKSPSVEDIVGFLG